MTWGYSRYNCAGLPTLHTYQEAKAHFESVAPIRGRAHYEKPLGKNRRFSWYQIREHKSSVLVDGDPLGQFVTTYGCMLYPRGDAWTPTIEYFPNGDIKLNVQWYCPTSMDYVNYILNGLLKLESFNGKWYVSCGDGNYYLLYRDMVFSRTESGQLQPTNPIQEHKLSVNRKVIKAIRNSIKHFVDYGKTALSLDSHVPRMELEELEGFKHGLQRRNLFNMNWYNDKIKEEVIGTRNALFSIMYNNDLDAHYHVLGYISEQAGWYSYKNNTYICTPEAFTKYVDELIKYHYANEIFNKEPIEIGKPFYCRNRKYFN